MLGLRHCCLASTHLLMWHYCHDFPTFLVQFILLTCLINSPVIPDPVLLTWLSHSLHLVLTPVSPAAPPLISPSLFSSLTSNCPLTGCLVCQCLTLQRIPSISSDLPVMTLFACWPDVRFLPAPFLDLLPCVDGPPGYTIIVILLPYFDFSEPWPLALCHRSTVVPQPCGMHQGRSFACGPIRIACSKNYFAHYICILIRVIYTLFIARKKNTFPRFPMRPRAC